MSNKLAENVKTSFKNFFALKNYSLAFRVAALTKLPRAVIEESEELQVSIPFFFFFLLKESIDLCFRCV